MGHSICGTIVEDPSGMQGKVLFGRWIGHIGSLRVFLESLEIEGVWGVKWGLRGKQEEGWCWGLFWSRQGRDKSSTLNISLISLIKRPLPSLSPSSSSFLLPLLPSASWRLCLPLGSLVPTLVPLLPPELSAMAPLNLSAGLFSSGLLTNLDDPRVESTFLWCASSFHSGYIPVWTYPPCYHAMTAESVSVLSLSLVRLFCLGFLAQAQL